MEPKAAVLGHADDRATPRTVVVTGASSGMGRATALRLAGRGDNVVLSSRSTDALHELARRCEEQGGRALVVPADVTDEDAVQDVARSAIAEFGGFDAWVNTAAVQSFGMLWETPTRTIRRVVDVNLVGTILVAKTALAHFRDRRAGTLVLVSSILSKTPATYLNAYTATKHGIAGLAASLRVDLKVDGLDGKVHVVNLMPASTDTPFFVHAANYTGKLPRPPHPMYSPDDVAATILGALEEPKDEVVVGTIPKMMRVAHAVAPGAYESAAASETVTSGMFTDEAEPSTDGNLFEVMPARTARREGGWAKGEPLKKTPP